MVDQVQEHMGVRLQQLRRTTGLSQAQMAAGLGISQTYISQVERGERSPSWKLLLRYAEVSRCSVLEILRRAGLLDNQTQAVEALVAELVTRFPGIRQLLGLLEWFATNRPAGIDDILQFAEFLATRGTGDCRSTWASGKENIGGGDDG